MNPFNVMILLSKIFPQFTERLNPNKYSFGKYSFGIRTPDFIVNIYFGNSSTLVTLDHSSCFNKDGQNPISFILEDMFNKKGLLNRRGKRLLAALEYLKTKEGQHSSNTFVNERCWEEFGQHIRRDFYQQLN